jgi:hypothetical protein
MPPRRDPGQPLRRAHRVERRLRRIAILSLLASVLLITLLLTAFGGHPHAAQGVIAPPARLPPNGPPTPQVVALAGSLRLQLPIAQGRVTAIGYHPVADGALALRPLGRQGNEGLVDRLVHRVFGGPRGGLAYYQLRGGGGPDTGALDVGAAPGTDVYSPVDGTVVALTDFVLNNRSYGVRVDIQPATAPSLLVSLTQLRPDPALSVGSSVAAGTSKIGTVLDLSGVERQALARYTQDAGNHVSIEVHPAAALALR